MLPHAMVEYVVAHELVHLIERSHNDAFWARLARLIPDHAERQAWLREHGGRYDL
jgi:predicted metal-dependent hydrolase